MRAAIVNRVHFILVIKKRDWTIFYHRNCPSFIAENIDIGDLNQISIR
jgi:hypothetical protein